MSNTARSRRTSAEGKSSARKVPVWAAAIAVCAVGGAAVTAASLSASADTLLSDSFSSSSLSGWSSSGGSWAVTSDGVLTQSKAGSENARLFGGTSSWGTYTVAAQVKPGTSGAAAVSAVLGHVASNTTFDRVVITGSGAVRLERVKSGNATVLASSTVSTPLAWHKVSVVESGSTVSGYVDGTLIGSGTSVASTGRIGLQTLTSAASFDSVAVDSSATSTPSTTSSTSTTTAAPTTSTSTSTSTSTTSTSTTTSKTTTSTTTTTSSSSTVSGSPIGYGAKTTGGTGGTAVTVTTLADLKTYAAKSGKYVITISGTISGAEAVKITSDKTIIGAKSGGTLAGVGLTLSSVDNVIVRNLTISKVLASSGDAIQIKKSTNIWIDHNDVSSDLTHGKDYYDGLIDITHAADYVTVSNNYIHDHYKASLVGHSDSNASEDTGYLHVTYYGNYFKNINSREPSIRFGTLHYFNNYVDGGITGVHTRMGAQGLIENNVFVNNDKPITTTGDSDEDGYANVSGNDLGGGTASITQVGTFTKAPYTYTLLATSSVKASVVANAGVGHI